MIIRWWMWLCGAGIVACLLTQDFRGVLLFLVAGLGDWLQEDDT